MLSLLRKEEPSATRVVEDLQELMVHMIRYGKPRLSYITDGWYCKVEMNTNTQGTQFDIASEFSHQSPLAAAKQCHERIINALKVLTQ